MSTLKPYRDKIIGQRVGKENERDSGIIKTSTGKEKPLVVKILESNVEDIRPGMHILIARYSGMEFDFRGDALLVIMPDDIVAIVGDEK